MLIPTQIREVKIVTTAKNTGGSGKSRPLFGSKERLNLHQLRLLEWHDGDAVGHRGRKADPIKEEQVSAIPDKWCLTRGINLYGWQKECIGRWFAGGCKGTVKVVTGGGKTTLALAIAERLQNENAPGLMVAVVVPTIVLMNQWYDELLASGNLPADAIARLGGGHGDVFDESKRVLISVLVSASKKLPDMIRDAGIAESLLLIVDECHRAGSKDMSKVFQTGRKFSLGLSATPERDEDEMENDSVYESSSLGRQLGPIIYDFDLAAALKSGIVPPYTISHYGLNLSAREKSRYERLSRSISDSESNLRGQAPAGKSSSARFHKWVQTVAKRDKSEIGRLASHLLADRFKRKALLYAIEARGKAVQTLLERAFKENPNARVIIFHERIEEVMKLFVRLYKKGFPVIAEHSELPSPVREAGLEIFRQGIAQIIISAKSLIEGFNVPAIDMAIIVASTTSVRQRVQSLGRVLRKHRNNSGAEKAPKIHVLYARNTVDEVIYGKLDWNQATGVDSNRYFHWDGRGVEVDQKEPPRHPPVTEEQVDDSLLHEGKEYPGDYEGAEYSCDTMGNIRCADGRHVVDPGSLPKLITKIKGAAGQFRVTTNRKYVLVRARSEGEWLTLFVTKLHKDFDVDAGEHPEEIDEHEVEVWAKKSSPGEKYPYGGIPIVDDNLRFSKKRNGVLAKKVKGGVVYARDASRAKDREMGADAEGLIDAVKLVRQSVGVNITQLEMNKLNHVLHRFAGELFFVYALRKGLEFPDQKP